MYSSPIYFSKIPNKFKTKIKEVISDFNIASNHSKDLYWESESIVVIRFVSYNVLFPEGKESYLSKFWARFGKTFPNSNGVFKFSRVGYNDQHNIAIVYYSYICGADCGSGNLLLLEKKNSVWKVVYDELQWRS